MPNKLDAGASALIRYVELCLDEIESRGREPYSQECDVLAEILVQLSVGNYQCEDITQRLEALLAVDLGARAKFRTGDRRSSEYTSIAEFRILLEIVRNRA